MKIVLIAGQSGVGKTTICKELCKNDRYNFIYSYTDRKMRERKEWGHTFIEPSYMDVLYDSEDIVAKTNIDGKRYCSIRSQFDEDKINVYIVDLKGINDVIDTFSRADIMTILIKRNDVEVDCLRMGRNVCMPAREDVDFAINNDHRIESTVGVINTLVGFDLFNKPSHKVESINSKLEHIEKQERYLKTIKESMLYQLWEQNHRAYLQLIKHISKKINDDFDFEITIEPDTEPDIHDGSLFFNVIAEYSEDVKWEVMDSMVAKMSHYAHEFCKDNGYDDLAYRLCIFEEYKSQDEF